MQAEARTIQQPHPTTNENTAITHEIVEENVAQLLPGLESAELRDRRMDAETGAPRLRQNPR
jgi:hypothetical protein